MNRATYLLIENYMLSCMEDSAHDKEHIYRVLYHALDIAESVSGVDYDVLVCACLLHDIGRKEQFNDPSVCHAQAGAEKAYTFLIENGFAPSFAEKVSDCILTHRFRKSLPPRGIEAEILFDADKLDVTGVTGIARTLIYKGIVTEPLYLLTENGEVSDGTCDEAPSFFGEYKYKLERLYDHFYTEKGRALAEERRQAAADFYNSLLTEVRQPYASGKAILEKMIVN